MKLKKAASQLDRFFSWWGKKDVLMKIIILVVVVAVILVAGSLLRAFLTILVPLVIVGAIIWLIWLLARRK